LVAGIIVAACSEVGPKIVVESEHIDLGTVVKGELADKVVYISNEGDEDLVIKSVFVSCGCTSADISSNRIAPGKKAELKISYDAQDAEEGKKSSEVYILSNDNSTPKLNIKVSVEVSPQKVKSDVPATDNESMP
jgi:hypothetical protein